MIFRNIFSASLMLALSAAGCSAQDNKTQTTQAQTTQAQTVQAQATQTLAKAETVSPTTAKVFPETAWRDVDPENLVYIDTDYGRIFVELFPEIAPAHVERIKTLTRQKFYDFITFHRVIEGFMNQTGDPKGDGTGDSDLPDLEAEFEFRRSPDMAVTLFDERAASPNDPNSVAGVGFYNGLPIASQQSGAAILTKDGKVRAAGLHCKGVTSMARSSDPNSANSQFFLMRGTADHLNGTYTVWGNTVHGHEILTQIKVGVAGQGNFVPDRMNKVQIAADINAAERVDVQIMDTNSAAFKAYLKTQKKADGTYPDLSLIHI